MKTITKPSVFGAPFATIDKPVSGTRLVTADDMWMLPAVAGGGRGYNTAGDVLTQTVDGRDLNALWNEFQTTVGIYNERRQVLIDLLTFQVTQTVEDVPQIGGADFEIASEFGVPVGARPDLAFLSLAYDFERYDIALRYTSQFLEDASASQIEAAHQSVLEGDSRLVFRKVMQALFAKENRASTINRQNYTVFSLYNGDGTVPPPYKGTTFDGNHTHYLASGAATIDSGDVEALIEHLRHHGYSASNGTQMLLLVNPAQTPAIRSWRANQANANAAVAQYDFVPAANQPPQLSTLTGIIGQAPPTTYNGMPVVGQYGPAIIVEEDYIPAGYIALIGSGGEGALRNPVGIREHANPGLRGLRLVKGAVPNYPLIDSYYQRGFGTGIRQRGGSALMQITTNATYTTPSTFQGI